MPRLKLFLMFVTIVSNNICMDNLPQNLSCRRCLNQLGAKCPVVRQDIHSVQDLKTLNLLANRGLVLKPSDLKDCEQLACVSDCLDNGQGFGADVVLDDLTALTIIAAIDFTQKE